MRGHPLTAAVGAAALLLAGTGGLVAADQRSDLALAARERAQAAAQAATDKQRAAYLSGLQQVAATLYDDVQPLQAAVELVINGEDLSLVVLDDIAGALVDADRAAASRTALEQLQPSPDLAAGQAQALAALDQLAKAVRTTARVLDERKLLDAVVAADLELDAATRALEAAVGPVLPRAALRPSEFGRDGSRPPLSRTSYLLQAGSICGRSVGEQAERLQDGLGEDERALAQAEADRLARDLPRLLAVRAPTGDDPQVASGIRAPLRQSADLTAGLRGLLAASRTGDAAALAEAERQVSRGTVAAGKAAAGYREYGSQSCVLYLVGTEEPAAEDDGTAT